MLRNKVIVLTGASGGIGAETAKLLAEKGGVLVLTGRNPQKLREVFSRLPGKHERHELDVTSDEQVRVFAAQVLDRYGKIDILINNAGFAVFERVVEATLDDYREMMDVNYLGVVRLTKAFLPSMLEAGEGHIINVASLAGKVATAKSSAYTAAKHAVIGFSGALRQELAGTGVKVSVINPGPVDTPFFERADPSGEYVRNLPAWFMLEPRDVAAAILDTIIRYKAEKNIPWVGGLGAKLLQLAPEMFEKMAQRIINIK